MDKLRKDIKEIYNFFSHNIRTFNSEIVTTIECFKLGFFKQGDGEDDLIYEAAYLLDLYDTVFNICLEDTLGDTPKINSEECDVAAITADLKKNIKGFLAESNIDMIYESTQKNLITDLFIFKNIYKVLLYEIIKLSEANVVISLKNNILQVAHGKLLSDLPPIMGIFINILKKLNIKCTVLNNLILLEFIK